MNKLVVGIGVGMIAIAYVIRSGVILGGGLLFCYIGLKEKKQNGIYEG
ncbi:MAG: hypothetical protein HXS54_05985 [Theionarchaea archaeon]|nr:hypothetical protein [Theionarchaea archaeon]DBA34809.1 TPA_asm: hypothetical protein vir521_00015 [Caudoviricetes sp. vir521]